MKTSSYSDKLRQYSVYYRTYSNVVTIRTIRAEYLIAMKLHSARQYKNDLSDILGILSEHGKRNTPLTMEQIRKAVTDLYGSWDVLSEFARSYIEDVMRDGRFEELYRMTVENEQLTKKLLVRFEQEHPDELTVSNVEAVSRNLQKKEGSGDILALIRERKKKDMPVRGNPEDTGSKQE